MKAGFKRKYDSWMSMEICVECDKIIKDTYLHGNKGICPNCGNIGDSKYKCSTYSVVFRRVTFYHINWWVFASYYTWIGKRKEDNDWLIRHNSKLHK